MRLSTSRQAASSACAPEVKAPSAAVRATAPKRTAAAGSRSGARPSVECLTSMSEHSTAPTSLAATPAAHAPLIDIGINLGHESYQEDRDAVLARARAAGVTQMIVTGSSLASTQSAISLARTRPSQLFATAGVHPHHASELTAERGSELLELARQREVVAVG